MSKWLTTKEAGDFLGVSKRTIQRYIKQGLLKTKTIKNRTTVKDTDLEAIKTGSKTTDQRQAGDKRHDTTSDNKEKVSQGFTPPDGYIVIDAETLKELRDQLRDLRTSVKEMQTTQKLLIEKGLNLKALPATTTADDITATETIKETVADIDAETDTKDSDKVATDDIKHSATKENAPQTTTEARIKPDNKKIKTIWETMGSWFK